MMHASCYGLPPRVRGNPMKCRPCRKARRPTPARAGQPDEVAVYKKVVAAYPRACGATADRVASVGNAMGLPPRVRGNRVPPAVLVDRDGPTPARAGQPPGPTARRRASEAYPRACGATSPRRRATTRRLGLPPRVRGNQRRPRLPRARVGPTPARAGQPLYSRDLPPPLTAYPRACGATPCVRPVSVCL